MSCRSWIPQTARAWTGVVAAGAAASLISCSPNPTSPSPTVLTATVGSCTYYLDTSSVPARLPATGGVIVVRLTTVNGCTWTTEKSFYLSQYLNFSTPNGLGTGGVGSGTVTVNVGPHTGAQERTIEFSVATIRVSAPQSAAAQPIPGPNALLQYASTAGSAIAYGQSNVLTTNQCQVPWTSTNGAARYRLGLQINCSPVAQWFEERFFIIMEAADGQDLKVGLYDNPHHWPGGSVPHPGNSLDVYFGSTGCAFVGQFEIFDIAFDDNANLQRLHTRIFEHCTTDVPDASVSIEIWYPSKAAVLH